MKKIKRFLCFALCAAMLTGLTACNDQTKTWDGVLTGALDSGTFELQIYTGGYGAEMWEELIAEFEAAYPDLNVVAYLDPNVNQQMSTRWMNQNPPDFVLLDGTGIPRDVWLEEGLLLDLTEWLESATVYGTQTKISQVLNEDIVATYKGKIYELPVWISAYGMWYDNTYFTQNNLSMPESYTELKAFTQRAAELGKPVMCYPGQYPGYLGWGFVLPAIAAYGQEFFDRVMSGTDPQVFLDERFVSVMERLEEYTSDNRNFLSGTVDLGHITAQTEWLAHNALLIPNGLWLRKEMEDSTPEDFDMIFSPSPLITEDQTPTIPVTGITVGISTFGDNQIAAMEFMRFLYQNDVLANFMTLSDTPVAADVDLTGIEISETLQQIQEIMSSPDIQVVTKKTSWGAVDAVFNNSMNEIVLGMKTAEQLCNEYAEAAKKNG